MNFTVSELRQATGGILHSGDGSRVVTKLNTDTRTIREGDVFIALNGKNFRGDEFVGEALRKGASGIITSLDASSVELKRGTFFLQVPDTTRALGDIAREWRMVVDPQICALTGSAGKTTTKEMLAFICREDFSTLSTEGNFNNHIGLPLTLLRLREEHEVAVIEMGMNHGGELTYLTRTCLPDVMIITNIGNAHLGNFGTVEKLIAAKAEPFEAMPREGTAVINSDCPHCSMMAEAFDIPAMVITYGQNKEADVQARNVRLTKPFGYAFTLRILDSAHRVHLRVFGRYQVSNALAAAAAAATLGISPDRIAERLRAFNVPKLRAQTEWFDGVLIISDCYNASPDATITSLRSLADLSGINRRYAVLGDMHELGEHSEKYHRAVGQAVAEAQIDFLCTYGPEALSIRDEAERKGIAAKHFEDLEEIADFLDRKLDRGDALIVKGSRLMRLEDVLLKFRVRRSEMINGGLAQGKAAKGDQG